MAMMTLDIFRLSLGWALESCGHEVYHINSLNEGRLEEAIRVFQPDFFIDMGWDAEHSYPDRLFTLRQVLKRHGICHVYFAEEDALHYTYWSRKYVDFVMPDYVWTRGKECVPWYEALGIPAKFFDVGCNVQFHRMLPPMQELVCDISVLCNVQYYWDIYRRQSIQNLIVPLLHSNYHVQLWGKDWEKCGEYFDISPREGMHRGQLPYTLSPHAYNSAKVNISVQSMEEQISNRTFEIMSSGGFLLTSSTSCVREMLQPGVCCAASASPRETMDLVAHYLANEEERQQIARNGMQLARSAFAYQVTLPPMLEAVEDFLRQRERDVQYA